MSSNQRNVYREMQLEKIKKIIKQLAKVEYPTCYCNKNYESTNCMAYAIGATVPDYEQLYFPGGISGEMQLLIKDKVIEFFIRDMNFIGINIKSISMESAKARPDRGEQIIALFYSYEGKGDFHFIKKDREGGWSHKEGYIYPPKKIPYNFENVINGTYELMGFYSLRFR